MFKYLSLFLLSLFLLTACQSDYQVEVDLSPEEEQSLLKEIEEKTAEIEEKSSKEEQISLQTIDVARAHEKLGRLDKAIETYETFLEERTHSSVVYNNLGRLYEKVNDHEKAIETYEILIDRFFDFEYFKDISFIYLRMENPQKAQEYLNKWSEALNQTDDFTQKRIDKMLNE